MLFKSNKRDLLNSPSEYKNTEEQQKYNFNDMGTGMLLQKVMKVAVPVLSVAGIVAISFPSPVDAVFSRQTNSYRVCAGRLVNNNVSSEAASKACARALHPRRLSKCLTKIVKQTQLEAKDALASCEKARRPEELASCVVGISRNSKESADPEVLSFCDRSLLPTRFAQCVVGLRSEIDLVPTQAMETCIDASDPITNISP